MGTADRWQPPIAAATARIVQPGQALSWTDARGVEHTLRADRNGMVWPETPDQVILADRLGLATATDWGMPDWSDPAADQPAEDPRTLAELKARATELGVPVQKGAKRPDLLAAVLAAEAAATGDAGSDDETDETGDGAGEED